ncbi:MAG: MFS transporter [Hyphomicrobiales bacterium]|nr:MFS transporter [Hyphomicrobiales bacterium]
MSASSPAGPTDRELATGWRLILACALGVGFGSVGFNTYAIGAFVNPLGHEFGWTRAQVQGAIAFGVGLGGLASPLVGLIIDRYGGRRIAMFGLVGVSAGYVIAATTGPTLWNFYAAYAVIALLGAGSAPVTWSRAIAERFDRRRGFALALALTGTGMAAIMVPQYAVFVVTYYGWRAGLLALALLPLIALIFAIFFFRPSTEAPPRQPLSISTSANLYGITLSEASRSYRFWVLLFSILAMFLAITGIVPNLIPVLTDKGFTPAQAASVQSTYGLSLIFARLGIGWLLDRFWGPGVAAVVLTIPMLACLILLNDPGYFEAVLASMLVGAAAGAELDLLAFFTARYFGMRSYGRIYGLLYLGVALGAGFGPVSFAYFADVTGSYATSFQVALALFAFGGISILFLGRYPHHSRLATANG